MGRSQLASGNQFHAFRADEHPDDGDDLPDVLSIDHDMGTATFEHTHQSEGNDINNYGEMVGASQDPNSAQYRAAYKTPFSGKNQGWYVLGVLGQGTSAGNQSKALGINDNGLIVGWSYLNVSGVMRQRAFVASNAGVPGSSPMLDLNANTKILVNGVLQTANSQGWTLESAQKVNNGNWIVGFGTRYGVTRAFYLSPL